jgi:serine/threonine protein phosphatase 1
LQGNGVFGWLKSGLNGKRVASNSLATALFEHLSNSNSLIYAIGDIHGCADLLGKMLDEIIQNHKTNENSLKIIVLGDMIDRGPATSEALEMILAWINTPPRPLEMHVVKGNHEQMFLDFLSDPEKNGPFWLRNGGVETLKSYGLRLPSQNLSAKELRLAHRQALAAIPPRHITLLQSAKSLLISPDYVFCHACIDATLSLQQQDQQTLLWSRKFPADDEEYSGPIIVHGHEPHKLPVAARHHINVDTGAYATGVLTAVRIDGSQRNFLSVSNDRREARRA